MEMPLIADTLMLWIIIAAVAVMVVPLALLYAPARATILVDTTASTARADLRPLWGLWPSFSVRALPKGGAGERLRQFNDPSHVGHALMTPGLADVAYEALRRLYLLKPRVAKLALAVNLADSAQNLVVETAAQAALAAAPAALREAVSISRCEAPGAEIAARFELTASPMQLRAIWGRLKGSRPAREFLRRLRSKPKPVKKPVREVRAS
jgi:hypothetical protein